MRKANLNVLAVLLLTVIVLAACNGDQEAADEGVVQAATATERLTPVPTQVPTATKLPTEQPTVGPTATEKPTQAPTPLPTDTSEPTEESVSSSAEAEMHEEQEHSHEEVASQGLELFRSIGCAACHGQDGEGGTGPAIAGHTAEQVQRQVRTPRGNIMPAYSEEQLSADQLAMIVAWVESLGPATAEHDHEHEHADDVAAETEHPADADAHLRLAFFAVKDGNAHDAEHHLETAIAALEDEHAKAEAEEILAILNDGADLHDVEHDLEHVLEDMHHDMDGFDGPSFHLQLVLDSLTLGDPESALHHLDHYAEMVADDAELVEEARELRELLKAGDLHDAEDGVRALLTGEEHHH